MLKVVGTASKPSVDTPASTPEATNTSSASIEVDLTFKVNLRDLRAQKRALIGICEGSVVTADQEEAAEGILNMIDFIQDSIVEQGLVSEDEMFPRLPSLFKAA